MPFVAFFVVISLGAAINIENSGNPVDTPKEAFERTVDAVKEGYNQDGYTSFKLND